jgi:hypothetical protein
MTNRPRILIADDHNLVVELCKKLLETEFNVVGMVAMVVPWCVRPRH